MHSQQEQQYLDLLQNLIVHGKVKTDRTGTGTLSKFGHQMRFNLAEGFPLLTTKKVHFKSILTELLWFLKGDTNIQYLLKHDCTIWTEWRYKEYLQKHQERCTQIPYNPLSQDEFENLIKTNDNFAKEWGDIGKGYGHQWRNFGEVKMSDVDPILLASTKGEMHSDDIIASGFDQISWLINEIKTHPDSRRLIIAGWNPHEVTQVDLPPCHTLFQFAVEPMTETERLVILESSYTGGYQQCKKDYLTAHNRNTFIEVSDLIDWASVPLSKLSCQLYQRSADTFLGVPFNIASYALLMHIVAHYTGMAVGDFVWTGGDVHLYRNHTEQAALQLSREGYLLPQIKLNIPAGVSFDQLEHDHFTLENYQSHPPIKADVAV